MARAREGGNAKLMFNGYTEFQFGMMKKVLEMAGGDERTTM